MMVAQFNIARLLHPRGDARVAGFEDNSARIGALAKRSDGYVWSLPEDEMQAACADPAGPFGDDPRMTATLSVWRDEAALEHFAHRTVHVRFYRQRAEWFEPHEGPHLVVWDIEDEAWPTLPEAIDRLDHLAAHGGTDHARGWGPWARGAA